LDAITSKDRHVQESERRDRRLESFFSRVNPETGNS
jgi:hypothetical protein